MLEIELLNMGVILFIEWIKTLFIFSIIDFIFIRRKIMETLRMHDTYISSLVVATFLIVARGQELSTLKFLFWAFITMISYSILKEIFKVIIN